MTQSTASRLAEHEPGGRVDTDDDGVVLDVEDLVTHFRIPRGVVKAVDGVSFRVGPGRTLGVVGESGSGKTVLSRSIMGLLPRENVLRAGHVRLGGQELTTLTPRQLRQVWGVQVGMVFQDPMSSLHPLRTIGVQVTAPLRRHLELGTRHARRTAVDLLASVGLPDPARTLDAYPHQLSGGMRQRVMIAIALSCGPRLLLADEPTTALDVTVQKQILDLLEREKTERSMAVVLVTHDLGVVASSSDDVAVMYAGKIVEMAPTRKLVSDMRMPYTEALFRSIPRLSDASHTPVPAIPGRPPDLARLGPGCSFAPRCAYATDQCRAAAPALRPVDAGSDHLVACWHPLSSSGRSALAAAKIAPAAAPAAAPAPAALNARTVS